MALVPITASELELKLLKGLPVLTKPQETIEFNENEAREYLIQEYDKDGANDRILVLAYMIYDSNKNNQASWFDEVGVSYEDSLDIILLLSAKLLKLFVQLNSTGPAIKFGENCPISTTTRAVYEELNVKSKLELDGYEISEHAVLPQLLIVAQELLGIHSGTPEIWIGRLFGWWCIRAFFLHQKILEGRSLTLSSGIGAAAAAIQTQFDVFEEDKDLKTLWFCELCDIHSYYYDLVSAKGCLANAGESCGVQFYTTGALGKKTKFQQKDLAQLVVRAKVDEDDSAVDNNTAYLEEFKNSRSLVNVLLNDDTRLEKLSLKDDDKERTTTLTSIQQVLLVSELNYLKKSQPKDELIKEGILAYVQSLVEEPKLWNVLMVALMHRSLVETDHFRTVERSMMQFENIQKAVEDNTPSFNARYQFYHATSMPLTWEIQVALGDVLLSLGQVKSALDIYLKLNLWENVIVCYSLLELRHKAAEVIQEQIRKYGESPKLLVYLGDATSDLACYDKAWALSNEKNFLSRQRLGTYWFKKQDYAQAIPYLQKAVELNPLEHPVWVRLGYAALQAENWELATKAYTHANSLDDESFENWNNLANATLKLGNKEQALRALKQATKCNHDEWKVWENIMVVALQCYDIEWTVMAINRLMDIKGAYADATVFRLLVDLVSDDNWDKKGDSSARSKDSVVKLFGRVTSKVTTNADVWQSYSTLLHRIVSKSSSSKEELSEESVADKWHKLIQYQQKAVRCHIQTKNWDKLPKVTRQVVECVNILCSKTGEFLNTFPSNPACQDFKVQAEFLHKQVSNVINKNLKEVPDPTVYEEFAKRLQEGASSLSGVNNAK